MNRDKQLVHMFEDWIFQYRRVEHSEEEASRYNLGTLLFKLLTVDPQSWDEWF